MLTLLIGNPVAELVPVTLIVKVLVLSYDVAARVMITLKYRSAQLDAGAVMLYCEGDCAVAVPLVKVP